MGSKIFALIFIAMSFIGVSQSTPIVMNPASNGSTINSCLATLFDSGGSGTGSGQYQNNELLTITICPDVPGDYITLVWTVFNLDPTNTSAVPNQTNADNITVFDGDDITAPSLGTYFSGDVSPGDVFGATTTNPTGCLTIQFASNNVGVGDFNAQLSCATPCDPPFADGIIVNADNSTGDSIAVCIDEEITFQDNGSTAGASGLFVLEKWVWNWNDGSSNDTLLSGAAVPHSFSQPGQYTVQLTVIDDNDCINANATDIRVFVSTFPTFIPFPVDTTLCIGESLTLTAAPSVYDQTWTGFPSQVTNPDNCLEDSPGIAQPTPLPLTGFDPTTTLTNANPDILSICVEMEHSFIDDFVLQVQCPTGQVMTLHQQGGGGIQLGDPEQGVIDCGDQGTFGTPWTYCFDAASTQTWAQAATAGGTNLVPNSSPTDQSLVAGNYAPADPLGFAALDGCPINGTWNLLFTDLVNLDDGSLPSWSINFASNLYPPVTVFTPVTGLGSDSSFWQLGDPSITYNSVDFDTIVIAPTTAGSETYNYSLVNNFGCTFDTSITITVDSLRPINAGPDITICGGQPVIIGPDSTSGINCEYRLLLFDSFGDSWNGNEIEVTTQAGGAVTFPGPAVDSLWVTLPVTNGENIIIDFNNIGAFSNECEIYLFDGSGNLVYSDGLAGAPSNNPQNVVANCFLGYSFSWTPTANILSSPTVINPQVNPPVSTTYTLSTFPTAHPMCISTDDVEVLIGPLIDPGNDTIANICINQGPVDLFNFIGGTPQTNGYWITSAGVMVNMPIDPATFTPGIYEYRIDSLNCSLSSFLTVNIIDLPITMVTTDVTCATASDGTIDLSSPFANSFSIDGGSTFQPIGLFQNLSSGTYNIVITSAPNGNCNASTIAVIDEPDSLEITFLTPSSIVCENIDLQASASGGNGNYTFTWDHNLGNGKTVDYSPTFSDSVCVTLSEDCPSPTVSKCTYMTVFAPVDFKYEFEDEIDPLVTAGCYDHPFKINNLSSSQDVISAGGVVTNPATDVTKMNTTWNIIGANISTSNSSGLSPVFSNLSIPGLYDIEVKIRTEQGCEQIEYLTEIIEVYNHPVANFVFSPNQVTIYNSQANFNDISEGNPVEWSWQFFGGPTPNTSTQKNPVINYEEGKPGNFQVDLTITDENGCQDKTTKYIDVVNDVNIFAPNIFTPDGDDINANWRVYISGIDIYDYHLSIFNRWGELVFESFDQEAAWDGTYGNSGEVALSGNYVWIVDAKDLRKDNRYSFTGSLLILK